MGCLNHPNTPTCFPFSPGTQATSPDVSFASPDLSLRSSWKVVYALIGPPVNSHWYPARYALAGQTHLHLEVSFLQNTNISLRLTALLTSSTVRFLLRTRPTSLAGLVRRYSSAIILEIKALLLQRTHLRYQFLTQGVAERILLVSVDISTEDRDHAESLWKEVLDSTSFCPTP